MPRPARGLVAVGAAMLVAAGGASAHVVVSPAFLTSGTATTVSLEVPNERDVAMTGLVVAVPAGIEIEEALGPEGWNAVVEGARATWSAGSIPPGLQETFGLRIRAMVEPGTASLEAEQLFRDGGRVSWPVSLTVVPGSSTAVAESSRRSGALAAMLVALGLVLAATIALLARRRRARSLQER